MLRPAFAKMFGAELFLHQPDVRLFRILRVSRLKCPHLLRSGRQPGQHNRHTAHKVLRRGRPVRRHPSLGQTRTQKRINWIPFPMRDVRPFDRLKRPMRFADRPSSNTQQYCDNLK